MIMTILEAHVEANKSAILEQAYNSTTKQLPPEIYETFLVRSLNEPNLWRIITIWQSREALEEMKRQGTPAGVLIFREASAEPTLSVFDIASSALTSSSKEQQVS